MNVIGAAWTPVGSSNDQSSAPVSTSNACSRRSSAPPAKTTPPAVASEPPRFGDPHRSLPAIEPNSRCGRTALPISRRLTRGPPRSVCRTAAACTARRRVQRAAFAGAWRRPCPTAAPLRIPTRTPLRVSILGPRNQLDQRRETIERQEGEMANRIDRRAAPVGAAHVAGKRNRAVNARRREDAFRSQRAILSRHHERDCSVTPNASSALISMGTSGRGSVGKGWVGHASSPGTSLAGTRRSSTGKSGSPVSRLRRNRNPILVGCASAGISRPPRCIVKSTGCAGMS